MEYKKLGELPPASQEMRRTFAAPALTVQQSMRGCFQECFGCEAQTEYRVYSGHVEQGQPRAQGIPPVGHLLEESSCLARACCGASRGFQMNFTAPDAEGKKILVFKKGWSLPICCVVPAGENGSISCPCCCCLPSLETYQIDGAGDSGSLIGSTEYVCDQNLCVPKFVVKDHNGAPSYLVRPETCCGGCCLVMRCGGKGSRLMYIPFLVRDPASGAPLPGAVAGGPPAQIEKVWAGLKKECCSDADNFQVMFPANAGTHEKANLLGATVLLDFSFFETQKSP